MRARYRNALKLAVTKLCSSHMSLGCSLIDESHRHLGGMEMQVGRYIDALNLSCEGAGLLRQDTATQAGCKCVSERLWGHVLCASGLTGSGAYQSSAQWRPPLTMNTAYLD